MNSKNVIFTLFLTLALVGSFIKRMGQEPRVREAFDRHPKHLVFTKHAWCRMDCRHIGKEDIEEIMEHGIIYLNKSNRNDYPCPTYAMQGTTSDGESLRVIFAQCDAETKVVTCYNLKQDFECQCPGDEKGGKK